MRGGSSILKIQRMSSSPLIVPQNHDDHDDHDHDPTIKNPNSTTPINLNSPTPPIADPRILSLRRNSQTSRLPSATFRSFGSKDEAFYDTQAWLDSDCDDDFYSVGGDFSSRGSTPSHSAVGTPRLNRVFSPQINRAVFEGRPPLRSGSSLSRGHQRNSSSPQVNGTYSGVVPSPNRDTTSKKKKKSLSDLFRESIRERAGEFLALDGQSESKKEVSTNSPVSVLPPKSGKLRTPRVSGPLSQSSSGKITPAHNCFPDTDKTLKFQQCCFPRLTSIRSYRENRKTSNSPNPSSG